MTRVTIASKDLGTGEVIIHEQSGVAGYHTLCGISLNDDAFVEVEITGKDKITCASCFRVYVSTKYLRLEDFAANLK